MEGSTRRRLSGMLVAGALAIACAAGIARASVGRVEQQGVFALLGGTPKIVSEFWADHASGLTATLKVRQFLPGGKTAILNYAVVMQRTMHMVVVRDDFATFVHLHPAFDLETGTFQQRFTKDPNHKYYLYADSVPNGIGQQVFRFTMESDGPVAASQPSLTISEPTASVGPYTVTLARTTLTANQPQKLDITIREGGKPAPDLTTYLGAAGHAVFINTTSLAYVHVHPVARGTTTVATPNGSSTSQMEMGGPPSPYLRLDLPALPAGTYKLWLQFRNQSLKVYTVPFTVAVQ